MSKRKHKPEDGVFLSDNLAATVISLLQDVQPERVNDAAAALKQLKADPQRTRQATEYTSAMEAAQDLGIDYHYDKPEYKLALKDTSDDTKALNIHIAYVVKELQIGRYIGPRRVEARSRTILDIIFLDRLKSLQNQESHHHLQLDPEVKISAISNYNEKIQGRMDWALNYDLKDPGSILVILETKRVGRAYLGLPQLLVYMAGVFQSRRDRINQTVWGMVSDSRTFEFSFLDDKKKFYSSLSYRWADEKSKILAYIDAILLDAVHSSPHTTPTKTGNAILLNYQRYLKTRWRFGEESDDEAVSDTDPESIVDVFMEEKSIVLRPARKEEAEISKEVEAVSEGEARG